MINHKKFLKQAINESLQSIKEGSSPFGAVIVKNGCIIAKAQNSVVLTHDATAHAEINAIRQAGQILKTFDLSNCVLYTSCEPCPMCLNAIKWANIKDVYFATDRTDAEAIGFRDRFFYDEDNVSLHRINIENAKKIMNDWFLSKTKKPY